MAFPWTLQRYIFREMGKAFVLAGIGLTGVLGLGGGILNMIKLGEVTPEQLVRLMAMLLPLSAALTLPVAALFSAAVTYGRLSADNEFVACRSSGINMHVLFLPTVVLSLLTAVISFGLTNSVIPAMVRNLDEMIYADLGSLFRQRLNQPRGIALGNGIRISADESVTDASDPKRFVVRRLAFLQSDDEAWVRYGTARELVLEFDRAGSTVRVAGVMHGLSYFDRNLGQFFEEAQQVIPPNEVPSLVEEDVKFLNLRELLYYRRHPARWHAVREKIDELRTAVGQRMIFDALVAEWVRNDQRIELGSNDGRRYLIRSAGANQSPESGEIELLDVTVQVTGAERDRRITASRATFRLTRGRRVADAGIEIRLEDATITAGDVTVERAQETLGPCAIDAAVAASIESLSLERLLTTEAGGTSAPLQRRRAAVMETRGEFVREATSAIHQRATFSLSVFVLVILAAVLGIIFRGSHVMTAFGISFVPTLFVLVTIVMGKQMAQNAPTHLAGIGLMWSGIALVLLIDLWMLTRVLRR